MVLDGPINGDLFDAYVDQVFVPDLRRGDVVIMDERSGKWAVRPVERRPDRAEPKYACLKKCISAF